MLAYPDIINVRPGTLDNPAIAKPIAQAWTRLAHPWAIAPDVRGFEENPTDIEALVKAWRGNISRLD